MEKDFLSSVLLFRVKFVLVETIAQIKVKAISYRVTSVLLLDTIFYAFFIYIYSFRWKQFFDIVETFFNESFIAAGGIRIFV